MSSQGNGAGVVDEGLIRPAIRASCETGYRRNIFTQE